MIRASGLALALASLSSALSWDATPFNPASVPLAVRSPYLSTWLPQGGGAALNGAWPTHWAGQVTAWTGYVKVDNATYTFLGTPGNRGSTGAVQKSFSFTSTQSAFVLTAGAIDLNITFLSPVEPDNLVKQSVPFSYVFITASSNDGNAHEVQVYTDISGEWLTGSTSWLAEWQHSSSGSILTHELQLQNQAAYSEINDRVQQGAVYYSTMKTEESSYQIGEDTTVRGQFIQYGSLTNVVDAYFRAVDDAWPVFAYTHNLGSVKGASSTIVYSIGHVRDPAVSYIVSDRKGGSRQQDRSLYFWSHYSTISAVISDFMHDFKAAMSRANALDRRIEADASKISSNYAAIVALSIRQALGATELTISKTSGGSWNTSDVLMFMKEISSDGNVNTVDVIFPSWPIFLYLNPTWGKYLLLPLYQYQSIGVYPNPWSVHDMGAHYPVANGHNLGTDEAMPVEESGNMLIMALSYTQKTGDKSLIRTYSGLLDQWTQFLIQDSIIPANQISTDDFAGALANQTNLAIKGITGIKAMSVIDGLLGNKAKSENYSAIATDYATQFLNLGGQSSTGPHLTLDYGDDSSWGMAYNLWADKHLKLNLFPDSIYTQQTAWYPTVEQEYGLPLDTRHPTTWTKSDWQIFTAATVTNTTVRNHIVDLVYSYASNGLNSVPFSDWYDASTGKTDGFLARPVVGGHLALLAV